MPLPLLLGGLLAAAHAAAPAPAAAAPAPRPHWVVNWGEPRCVLGREGGADDAGIAVRFVPGDRRFELWIVDPHWSRNSFGRTPPVELVLEGESGPPIKNFYFLPFGNTGRQALAVESAGEDFFDRLAKSKALSVRSKGSEVLRFPVPGAAAAVAAARQCEDNMLRKWGVDPVAYRALKERPEPVEMDRWLTSSDYPDSALRSGVTGITVTRISVDARGKVGACTLVVPSGSKVLDDATCVAATKRGRFSPARDANGKAVPAFRILTVSWRLFG